MLQAETGGEFDALAGAMLPGEGLELAESDRAVGDLEIAGGIDGGAPARTELHANAAQVGTGGEDEVVLHAAGLAVDQ